MQTGAPREASVEVAPVGDDHATDHALEALEALQLHRIKFDRVQALGREQFLVDRPEASRAVDHHDVGVERLRVANNIDNGEPLLAGSRLQIP